MSKNLEGLFTNIPDSSIHYFIYDWRSTIFDLRSRRMPTVTPQITIHQKKRRGSGAFFLQSKSDTNLNQL
jgi:hypothetical protein